MPRIALDLNKADDRRHIKGEWRFAMGFVPGEPNEGLAAQLRATPARLAQGRQRCASGLVKCRKCLADELIGRGGSA